MLLDLYDEAEYRVRQAFAASRRGMGKLGDGVRRINARQAHVAALTVAAGIVLWGWRAARKLRRIPDEQQWEQALAQALDAGHGQVAAVLTNDACSKWVPPIAPCVCSCPPAAARLRIQKAAALKTQTLRAGRGCLGA